MRKVKEEELQEMQQRMQTYNNTIQQAAKQKEEELFQPIYDKANKAIKDIGDENGFIYVFDISTGVIVHLSKDSKDILPLVKKKLGIE